MLSFADQLRRARTTAGLTQSELATRSGVARPNVVAYESGRREPRFDNAVGLLAAARAAVRIEPAVSWCWTSHWRPVAVPSRLWRLEPVDALRTFDAAVHLWWSGPQRTFDLADRSDRCRAYEVVLREGRPEDIESIVDGVLLCEAWPDLVVPRHLRDAWKPVIEANIGARHAAAS
jgi:transcriptional regulator with XRE-family HTH domain